MKMNRYMSRSLVEVILDEVPSARKRESASHKYASTHVAAQTPLGRFREVASRTATWKDTHRKSKVRRKVSEVLDIPKTETGAIEQAGLGNHPYHPAF